MAISTCGKCGNTEFEMVENIPAGSEFKVMFIQCDMCGVVVGVTGYFNTASLLEKIAAKLGFDLHSRY